MSRCSNQLRTDYKEKNKELIQSNMYYFCMFFSKFLQMSAKAMSIRMNSIFLFRAIFGCHIVSMLCTCKNVLGRQKLFILNIHKMIFLDKETCIKMHRQHLVCTLVQTNARSTTGVFSKPTNSILKVKDIFLCKFHTIKLHV